MFGVLDKNIELPAIFLEECIEVSNVRENLGDFRVNDWKALLNDIVGDTVRMHTSHKQIIS